ncbi:terminase gpA endonuclease subunit [Paenirhodobacter populi]|uniref:Phage terminase large subunit family protein n=1 Tax=Paenirhodobacter populi TaxID=2306993 RepID=A0A443J087_9RHOB|nr:terminase gpA endonuclease subunit [Sinirhodobacter populi]RWR13839.1 hypothetical protein D2T33_05435 [Sinirhodobacter populi]
MSFLTMNDTGQYIRTVSGLFASCLAGLRPPERITLSEFSQKNIWVDGVMTAGRERFNFGKHEYQREILDSLSDPECQGVYLVAPSRWGKTALVPNLVAHTVETNPMDIMIVQTSRSNAVTFAKGDLDDFFETNDWFASKIRPGRTTNSLLMKKFRNGTILSVVWPSAKNLAGVNRGVICIPDYDHTKASVDGQGALVTVASTRAKAYGSRKTIFVDSSPAREPIKYERFEPESPHQAPPYPGIFSLYNTGDRRLYYWQCTCCRQWFRAHPDHLKYDDHGTNKERAGTARMVCPNEECAAEYRHDGDPANGMPGKDELNAKGRWVPDGMSLDEGGNLIGKMLNPPVPGVDNFRSYWAFGVCSASQTWEKLVLDKLDAEAEYERSGDPGPLQACLNSNFGLPWFPPHLGGGDDWERYYERAEQYLHGVVPPEARYLIVSVDTQGTSWVMQTHAFGPEGRMWCIDRRRIVSSDRDHETRKNADGTPEKAWVRPGTYPEDWKVLERELASLRYPLADGSGVMTPVIIGVDSNGLDATTDNAYAWWMSLSGPQLPKSRVRLIKGDPKLKVLCETKKSDGTKRSDRKAFRGDTPILFVSSNMAKDVMAANLAREVDGPGYVHLPQWWKTDYFKELAAEQRRGDEWVKIRKRNEAWDLFVYALALNRSETMRADRIDWTSDRLPAYALPASQNPFVSPVSVAPDGTQVVGSAPTGRRPYLSREQIGQQFLEMSGGNNGYP